MRTAWPVNLPIITEQGSYCHGTLEALFDIEVT